LEKHEIRNPKLETSTNLEIRNRFDSLAVLVFQFDAHGVSDFDIRISDFRFYI